VCLCADFPLEISDVPLAVEVAAPIDGIMANTTLKRGCAIAAEPAFVRRSLAFDSIPRAATLDGATQRYVTDVFFELKTSVCALRLGSDEQDPVNATQG
jgi:hypothetical protein